MDNSHLPTLDEFIANPAMRNSYVRHKGFSVLYVRKGSIYIAAPDHMVPCDNVFQIANVQARPKGKGAFTRLVHDLLKLDYAVYVENVFPERLQKHLLRNGFVEVNPGMGMSRCFIKNHEKHMRWGGVPACQTQST
jgi:hypothetical protein